MWPFNRRKKQDQSSVPSEIQDYYQSERRERVGVAWLLALATLAITVILALILFFGGRWIYRTVFDNNGGDNGATTQQEQENGDEQTGGDEQDDADDGTDSEAPTQLPGDGETPDDGSDDGTADDGEGDTPAGGSGGAAPNQTPNTGPEGPESTLPRTGPADGFID